MVDRKKNDPISSFRFWVEIDGLYEAGFTEVQGLEFETEVEEYKEGGVNGYVHRLPGRITSPSIILKRGFTRSHKLWDWYENVTTGDFERKSGAIILLDFNEEEVCRWNFYESFPIRWVGPELDASNSEMAIEIIELVHHGLKTIYR